MFKLSLKALLMLITLFCVANAQYAVRVYSKHESIQDSNVSRPRIYVENTGTETRLLGSDTELRYRELRMHDTTSKTYSQWKLINGSRR
ncbi:MAG: hypothetical protein LBI42_14195 [Chitinispirillales bacterium]|jgi:hypothetical protein|nr:hypothetical protein [Chitinispirillales bacterium]